MGRLTDKFFYVVAMICVVVIAAMLIAAVFALRGEIRANRQLGYEIECILLTPPEERTPLVVETCRDRAKEKI